MKLTAQRRLAAAILKCSPKRVRFDTEKLSEIKEAITKADLRGLIGQGSARKLPARGVSRARARKIAVQKSKGRQRGHGSRKGRKSARLDPKTTWMNKVRLQRHVLAQLKTEQKITPQDYKELYRKVKGGFFRNRRHLMLYIEEKQK